eukprot:PhM_4_TR10802/c0_g2_i1/m.9394
MLVDLQKGRGEKVAVFGDFNGIDGGAQHTHTVTFQHTSLLQSNTAVQGCLSTEAKENAIRLFLHNNTLDIRHSDRNEVDVVGDAFRRLHGCNVGVDQHGLDALLLEALATLGAAVVELTGLANRDTTSTENKDLAGARADVLVDAVALDVLDEVCEEVLCVLGAAAGLGVELDRDKWLRLVAETFVAGVVAVREVDGPVLRQCLRVDGVAVVLCRDHHTVRDVALARLVLSAVAVLELVRLRTTREAHHEVAHANAENGLLLLLRPMHGLNRLGAGHRVAGAVADEQTVVLLLRNVPVVRDNLERHVVL